MNLPSIFSGNSLMKKQQQNNKGSPSVKDLGIGDHFGLGIQVFKIQSHKNVASSDKNHQRNMIKNIQNPIAMRPPIPKKSHILPALNHEKQDKPITDFIRSKKSVERKPNITVQQIKAQPTFSKSVSQTKSTKYKTQKTTKIQQIPTQKTKIIMDYRNSFNQLKTFYIQFAKRQEERQRQLKKLKRLNDMEMSKQMKERMIWVASPQNIVIDVVNDSQFIGYQLRQQYEQNSITEYSNQNGFSIHSYQDWNSQQKI